jgi:hypothetical protein
MQESPNKNSEYKDYGTSKRSKTLIDIGRDSAAVKGTKSEKNRKGQHCRKRDQERKIEYGRENPNVKRRSKQRGTNEARHSEKNRQ